MKTNTEIIKGFRDYLNEEALKREAIKKTIVETFKLYGFSPAETPIVESEEFVRGNNTGDEAVSDIYKLKDKGNRDLALRYEFTFQLKRLSKNQKLPFKRYQLGPVFRDEPIKSNRFRQFTQCDADIIGSSFKEEVEILSLAKDIFDKLGIDFAINLGSRKLLNEILVSENIEERNRDSVIKEIDKLDKIGEKAVSDNLKRYNASKLLKIFKEKEKFFEKYGSYKEIKELIDLCRLYKIDVSFTPSLARGLSYYNGAIWEVKTKKFRETIAAGGSYLVNGMQSTGISFGIERLSDLISEKKLDLDNTKCIIISVNSDKESVKLASSLRKSNISCSIISGRISKALEYANSYKIPYVIFIGEEEIKKKKFKLKDMKSGKESYLDEKNLVKKLKV